MLFRMVLEWGSERSNAKSLFLGSNVNVGVAQPLLKQLKAKDTSKLLYLS